jgi:hypothetical protein
LTRAYKLNLPRVMRPFKAARNPRRNEKAVATVAATIAS